MGEIADMMIDGTMCPCGEFIDGGADGPGFTQYCSTQCQLDYGGPVEIDSTVKPPRTVLCREHPHCKRRFRTAGAERQHWIDKHDAAGDRPR